MKILQTENEMTWYFEDEFTNRPLNIEPKDKRQPTNKVLKAIEQHENYELYKLK